MSNSDVELIARTGCMISSLEALVQEKQVISFDVFDTLLARKLIEPSDVFDFIEKKFSIQGFSSARVKAETLARKRFGNSQSPEVSLDEIYIVLRDMLQGLDFGPDEEIAVEADFLFADPMVGRIVEIARKQGKRVIAISDMYLDSAQITALLARNGIELDAVYSSCDHRREGLGKFNASIFPYVARQENSTTSGILHFGDNLVSDVKHALETGVVGVHIRARREFLGNGDVMFMSHQNGHMSLTTSQVVGQILARLPGFDPEVSPAYSFGYTVAGPLVLGFCKFIAEQSQKDGVERLLLMARDGYIIQSALDILKIPVPAYEVMPISRRMAIFPFLQEDPDLFDRAFLQGQPQKISPRSLWLQLNLDIEMIQDHPDIDMPMSAARIRTLFAEQFNRAANEERAFLAEHLQKWCGDDPSKAAFVDVGWGLSTIQALDHELKAISPGYFVGIHSTAYRRRGLQGYLFEGASPEYVHDTVMSAVEILEVIFSHTGAGFSRLSKIDGQVTALKSELSSDEVLRNVFVSDLHKGTLQFLHDISHTTNDLDSGALCQFNREIISRLINAPTEQEYRVLAAIPHSRSASHASWETIGDYWKLSSHRQSSIEHASIMQRLRNYELLSPRLFKHLISRDDLDQLDWRRELKRHPFKISYWNAIRRYARRTNKKKPNSASAK